MKSGMYGICSLETSSHVVLEALHVEKASWTDLHLRLHSTGLR